MKDQRLQIADVVGHIDDSTLGNLNVPEFQRKYYLQGFRLSMRGTRAASRRDIRERVLMGPLPNATLF